MLMWSYRVSCHFQLDDSVQMGMLAPAAGPEVSLRLEGRGLRGGGRIHTTASWQSGRPDFGLCSPGVTLAGRFGQTTPPLVEFLKDILRRYPEGGQILKVSDGAEQ